MRLPQSPQRLAVAFSVFVLVAFLVAFREGMVRSFTLAERQNSLTACNAVECSDLFGLVVKGDVQWKSRSVEKNVQVKCSWNTMRTMAKSGSVHRRREIGKGRDNLFRNIAGMGEAWNGNVD